MASRIKAAALAISGVMLFTGVALEVDARIKQNARETAADISALYETHRLAAGAPHCVTSNTMRLYARASAENRVDYARSLVNRGLCNALHDAYEYELISDDGELAEVSVKLDDTEYKFWVESETLQ